MTTTEKTLSQLLDQKKSLAERLKELQTIRLNDLFEDKQEVIKTADSTTDLENSVERVTIGSITAEYDHCSQALEEVNDVLRQSNHGVQVEAEESIFSEYVVDPKSGMIKKSLATYITRRDLLDLKLKQLEPLKKNPNLFKTQITRTAKGKDGEFDAVALRVPRIEEDQVVAEYNHFAAARRQANDAIQHTNHSTKVTIDTRAFQVWKRPTKKKK